MSPCDCRLLDILRSLWVFSGPVEFVDEPDLDLISDLDLTFDSDCEEVNDAILVSSDLIVSRSVLASFRDCASACWTSFSCRSSSTSNAFRKLLSVLRNSLDFKSNLERVSCNCSARTCRSIRVLV